MAKKQTITVSVETAAALKAAADGVGAGSTGELLRLAVLDPVGIQRSYLAGSRSEIDARIARFDKRTAARSGGAVDGRRAAPAGAATDGRRAPTGAAAATDGRRASTGVAAAAAVDGRRAPGGPSA